jgi:hypothetical protein
VLALAHLRTVIASFGSAYVFVRDAEAWRRTGGDIENSCLFFWWAVFRNRNRRISLDFNLCYQFKSQEKIL